MANTTIRLRKSGVASNVPDSLELGELALNYADGKLYYKNADDLITFISSGATTNSFATINANSSLIIATSNTDVLSISGGTSIDVTPDTINKTIVISAKLTNSLTINDSNTAASSNATSQLANLVSIAQSVASGAAITASGANGLAIGAYGHANNAFDAANVGISLAQNAYNKGNSATSLAQSAYDYANTITGGGSTTTFFNYLTVQKQLYTANASQTDFFVNYTAPYVTVVVNGATIDSSEYSTLTANTIILNNPTSVGDVVDITGFYQANSATITAGGGSGTDQWVRDTANSAAANTIVTQGVDVWQNTRISSAFDKANSALPLTGGTVTGNVTFGQDVTISGNLYLSGNATTISTNNVTLNDSLIYLANENPANTVDIGIVGHFTEGHYQHTGVVRNHLNGSWVFFSNVSTEPTTTIDFAEANLVYDSITTGGVRAPVIYSLGGTSSIEMSDIGIIGINPSGGSGAGIKLVGKTVEGNKFFGGSYGGNYLSVENETKLVSDRYDIVTISTGTAGRQDNNWTFSNNQLIFPDNSYQNTAFIGVGVDSFARNAANGANGIAIGANGLAAGAYNKANNALANTTGTFAGDLTTTGNVIITSGQSSYSVGSGALTVNGGLGVSGNVYADKIYVNGLYWAANGNVISTGATSGVNQFNIYKFVATPGQTGFSGVDSGGQSLSYTPNAIIVTLNGLTLKPGTDYSATDGSIINLTVAADPSDELNVYAFTSTTVNTNTLTTYNYIATTGQTSFGGADAGSNILGYVPGNLFTTLNGITLRNGVDYTAANGTYINLTFNAAANDEVVVYTFGAFNVANTYTKTEVYTKSEVNALIASSSTAGKTLAINFFRS